MRRDLLAHLAVVGAALIFGSTFLVVKGAVEEVDPFAFLAVRFAIGAAVLWPAARRRPSAPGAWRAGGLCGLALAAGYVLQTVGLRSTSGSVSAFLTYLLVVLVPLLSAVVLRRSVGRSAWAGVALSTAGLVLLTGGARSFGVGEALTVGCAVAFAVHVLLLADLAPRHDPLRLNAVQLAVVAVACAPPGAALVDRFPPAAWAAAAFCGVAASAVALGLQTWAQARLPAVRVSLLLLVEPVSAAVLGALAGDRLGLLGAVGCAAILGGIATTELGLLDGRRAGEGPAPADVVPLADH